ncbi:cytochrome P450 2J4-like [Panulirus ornatus]|uniref:cytochrome P450 2J4-like n=1 Tax=Panulirus ornatus TaxID=150431 RepID=UPI003A83EF54
MLISVSEALHLAGIILLILVLLLILLPSGRPRNFPPGLPILPIVGSLLTMRGGPTRQILMDLKKTYGNMASFGIFGTRLVLVSGLPMLKEVFSQKVSAGRPEMLFSTTRNVLLSEGRDVTNIGVVGSWGRAWQDQRRFVLHHLRNLGFGKSTYEPIMMQEIMELLEYFAKEEGRPIAMKNTFNRTVVNVLWWMVMGKRYPYHHVKLHKLLQTFQSRADLNLLNPLYFIPGFLKALPNLPVLGRTTDTTRSVLAFVKTELRELSESEDLCNNASLAAMYLREIHNSKDESSVVHMDNLVAVLTEMFVAGMETTSSTLTMAIYLLAKHPKIQQRLQQELDQVVGRDKLPSLFDMDDEALPYTMATIHEVQRKLNLVLFALPHATIQDCIMAGYYIPKGTVLLPNLSDAMRDPELWRNPQEFDPENFLNEDGSYRKNEAFLPYGAGKRRCAGESLARQELFLILTCILHRFFFTLVEEEELPVTSPIFNQTPVYIAKAIPRGSPLSPSCHCS